MRWLDDLSMDLRKMGLNEWKDRARESRGLEAHCRGGQSPPRAVAPSGGRIFQYFQVLIMITVCKSNENVEF